MSQGQKDMKAVSMLHKLHRVVIYRANLRISYVTMKQIHDTKALTTTANPKKNMANQK